jgi:hypothetical protein
MLSPLRRLGSLGATRWLWLVTAGLLLAYLGGKPAALVLAALLTAGRAAYQATQLRRGGALATQVRALALVVMLLGSVPGLRWLLLVQLAAMSMLIAFDYCVAARLLALLPWNRSRPLTAVLLREALLTPPRCWHGRN